MSSHDTPGIVDRIVGRLKDESLFQPDDDLRDGIVYVPEARAGRLALASVHVMEVTAQGLAGHAENALAALAQAATESPEAAGVLEAALDRIIARHRPPAGRS